MRGRPNLLRKQGLHPEGPSTYRRKIEDNGSIFDIKISKNEKKGNWRIRLQCQHIPERAEADRKLMNLLKNLYVDPEAGQFITGRFELAQDSHDKELTGKNILLPHYAEAMFRLADELDGYLMAVIDNVPIKLYPKPYGSRKEVMGGVNTCDEKKAQEVLTKIDLLAADILKRNGGPYQPVEGSDVIDVFPGNQLLDRFDRLLELTAASAKSNETMQQSILEELKQINDFNQLKHAEIRDLRDLMKNHDQYIVKRINDIAEGQEKQFTELKLISESIDEIKEQIRSISGYEKGHNLRSQIIELLSQDQNLSVKELAQKLNRPYHTVYYHVQKLKESGFLSEEKKKRKKGPGRPRSVFSIKLKDSQFFAAPGSEVQYLALKDPQVQHQDQLRKSHRKRRKSRRRKK